MEFFKNVDQKDIENALLSGQSKVTINDIEISLSPLKRDTLKNKEREAKRIAEHLITII